MINFGIETKQLIGQIDAQIEEAISAFIDGRKIFCVKQGVSKMIKTTYAYDLFTLLQKYKSDVTQYDDELRTAQGFLTSKLFSLLLIIFLGGCLFGYSAFLYYQLVLFPNSSLF